MANRPRFEHIGIFGATQTGKSTVLRKFSRASDRDIIVYDPTHAQQDYHDGWRPGNERFFSKLIGGEDSQKTAIYSNPELFYIAAQNAENCDVFIDEAADIFDHAAKHRHALMVSGRHRGLRLFIATQRPRQVSPNVRQQCSALYIFRLAHDDMQAAVKDAGFNVSDLPCDSPRAVGECVTVDCVEGKLHSGFVNVTNTAGM